MKVKIEREDDSLDGGEIIILHLEDRFDPEVPILVAHRDIHKKDSSLPRTYIVPEYTFIELNSGVVIGKCEGMCTADDLKRLAIEYIKHRWEHDNPYTKLIRIEVLKNVELTIKAEVMI